MDRQTIYKRLLPIVNDERWSRVEDYLNYEQSILIQNLIKSTDIRLINKIQGEIARIESMLNLPSTIKKAATSE